MQTVGIVSLDELEQTQSPGEGEFGVAERALVRVAGVEIITRQIRTLLGAGVSKVIVVGDDLTAYETLVAEDSRLRDIASSTSGRSVAGLLEEHAGQRVIVVGPGVCFGAGVVREARAEAGRIEGVELWFGIAGSRTLEDAPPMSFENKDAYAVTVRRAHDVRSAKRHIFANVTKETSGWVSKNINSLFSIPVSYAISELPITPNMITVATTVVGFTSAWLFSLSDTWAVFLGGLLFQLAAAMDRVDGEIARSKFQASRHGAWIDTVGDNITYLLVVIGVTAGYYERVHQAWVWQAGAFMIVSLIAMLLTMYIYLLRHTDSGSLVAITTDVEERLRGQRKPLVYRVLDRIRFAGKRDFFSLACFVAAALDGLGVIFWCSMAVLGGTIAYFASAAGKARTRGTA